MTEVEQLKETLDNLRIAWEDMKRYVGDSDNDVLCTGGYVWLRMKEWEKEFEGQFEREN